MSGSSFVQFPNGLIMQWGKVANAGTRQVPMTFPISFPNGAFSLMCSQEQSNGRGSYASGDMLSNSGARIATDGCNTYWIALGH